MLVLPPLVLPPPKLPPGVKGRSDLQALNAALSAGLPDCRSANSPRKPLPEDDPLGSVTPCAERQLSNFWKAALNPTDPPNPPDGRSEAQAWRALLIAALLGVLPLEELPLEELPLDDRPP